VEILEIDSEEEIPGTPVKKAFPKVVTPKETKKVSEDDALGQLITDTQQEISNLTIPTTLAGPNPNASEESEAETVLSDENSKADKSEHKQSTEESIASRTRGSKNPKH
jgi:hypothetical protein